DGGGGGLRVGGARGLVEIVGGERGGPPGSPSRRVARATPARGPRSPSGLGGPLRPPVPAGPPEFPSHLSLRWGRVGARGGAASMSARELTTLLAGLMVAGVLVWSVTAWVFTSPVTLISRTLVGLLRGGLPPWGGGSRP